MFEVKFYSDRQLEIIAQHTEVMRGRALRHVYGPGASRYTLAILRTYLKVKAETGSENVKQSKFVSILRKRGGPAKQVEKLLGEPRGSRSSILNWLTESIAVGMLVRSELLRPVEYWMDEPEKVRCHEFRKLEQDIIQTVRAQIYDELNPEAGSNLGLPGEVYYNSLRKRFSKG